MLWIQDRVQMVLRLKQSGLQRWVVRIVWGWREDSRVERVWGEEERLRGLQEGIRRTVSERVCGQVGVFVDKGIVWLPDSVEVDEMLVGDLQIFSSGSGAPLGGLVGVVGVILAVLKCEINWPVLSAEK